MGIKILLQWSSFRKGRCWEKSAVVINKFLNTCKSKGK
jgi:hypothetical protein